jgi:Ethanolamine utilization protein EutJ (predicted chaperonin)
MSFEERLELIAQRHQALAETVEIVAGMQREAERREQERDAKYNEHFTRVLGVVEELASIVKSHERRIQDLEH